MKIKILQINQQLPDVSGNKNGNNWVMKHWMCNLLVNGQQVQAEVKSFDANLNLEINKEYEAEDKMYNGITSYQIAKEKKSWSGGSKKPSYTKDEYNELFKFALKKCGIDMNNISEDNRCKVFATYFIGAKDSGIKIESQKKLPEVQALNTNDTPPEPLNINEPIDVFNDDIPF